MKKDLTFLKIEDHHLIYTKTFTLQFTAILFALNVTKILTLKEIKKNKKGVAYVGFFQYFARFV